MNRYFGILLIIVAFIGTLFFRHYTGELISHPLIWYLAFAVLGLAGFFLVYKSIYSENTKATEIYSQTIAKIKASSQKIELDFNNCDIKNGSYTQQIDDTDLSTLKLIIPHSLSIYIDTTKTTTRSQSYLIYNETDSTGQRRFISQPFPIDPTTLEYYVMTKKLTLYVDRFERNKYYFDLDR